MSATRTRWMALLGLLAALVLGACGGGPTTVTDEATVTDDATVTEDVTEDIAEPEGGSGGGAELEPGDTVETELETPGGKRQEEEQVAPPKDQGDCPPGEVEAGGTCIPNQPSG